MKWSAKAILDIAQTYGWEKISVFYDDDSGVQVLEELMTNHTITVRAWRLGTHAKARQMRNALVEMRKVLVDKSVVLCSKENTHLLLEQVLEELMTNHTITVRAWRLGTHAKARQMRNALVEMRKVLVDKSVVLCSKENTHLLLEQARDLAMLSTPPYGWLFYDPGDEGQKVFTKYKEIAVNFTVVTLLDFNDSIQTYDHSRLDFALASDALQLVISSYSMLAAAASASSLNLSDVRVPFQLNLAIKNNVESGHTGFLDFNENGRRNNFSLSLTAITGDFNYQRGHWFSEPPELYSSLVLYNQQFPFNRSTPFPLRGRTARVVMIENATMSVAPLSINAQREEAVDFTKPFKTRYISVLMRIPRRETSYFEFLNPLSRIVWICTLCAFVVVSLVLYALERIGRDKNQQGGDSIEITVRESFWFIFGSLLQGNTDSTPCTIPGRILTSAWWFFALILISSYTANLAAFLTVKKINTPIKSVTDLAQQTKIKYGTVKDSGIMSFFKNTNIEHFSKMWAQIWWDNTNCPDMTKTTADETSSLQIDNVAGVFFILVGGIVIAAIVCLGEYFTAAMIKASKLAVAKKVSAKPKAKASTFASASNHGDAERDSFI
ncbi:glutamate receptor 8 [Elysia marginata]|uniref:Glutamate receptor 8 n=1 Tax=Elysia marginata TaxID=1093978 RepID=A0AAV4E9E4_9GAST|nr:glutamate receptor 8 [Elysia marginata]